MNAILLILMSLNLEETNKQQASVEKPGDPNNCDLCSVAKINRINAKYWFNNRH